MVTVPNVVGQASSDAMTALTEVGLVGQASSSGSEVHSQSPEAGRAVAIGSGVTLTMGISAAEQAAADQAAAAAEAAAQAALGTVSQQNAYTKAQSYLSYAAFSRSGLADQLEYEGFSAEDAEFAIARLEAAGGVDWNAQAAAKAASYLEYTSFSRSGLLDQLTYEGFTPEQAEYGVSTTGL